MYVINSSKFYYNDYNNGYFCMTLNEALLVYRDRYWSCLLFNKHYFWMLCLYTTLYQDDKMFIYSKYIFSFNLSGKIYYASIKYIISPLHSWQNYLYKQVHFLKNSGAFLLEKIKIFTAIVQKITTLMKALRFGPWTIKNITQISVFLP